MDNLHGWPRGNSRTNLFYDFHMGAEKIIRNLLTSEANKIYEWILQSQLYALPTPNYSEYESEGCIEYPQIQFWNDDFKKLGECEQGQVILGNPLSFTIGSRREGCYDTGWWTSIQHGLTTNKREILQKSI